MGQLPHRAAPIWRKLMCACIDRQAVTTERQPKGSSQLRSPFFGHQKYARKDTKTKLTIPTVTCNQNGNIEYFIRTFALSRNG